MTDEELTDLEDHASPGAGACGAQFTANTMAMAFEMLGISPMRDSGVPAQYAGKEDAAFRAGQLVMDVLAKWMALTGDEQHLIATANMHLPGRQVDPARVRRDLWRLQEWERRRMRRLARRSGDSADRGAGPAGNVPAP